MGLAIGLFLFAFLLPAVHKAQEAARRTQSRGHHKQLALAAHSFHDQIQHFPPVSVETDMPDGEPPHSWMVDLLPYLDERLLAEQYVRSKPWNDPANHRVGKTVIPLFINPSVPTASSGPADGSDYAAAHYTWNSQLISKQCGLGMPEITDGTGYTIMTGDVKAGVKPWIDPANMRDPALGIQGTAETFGSWHEGGVNVSMADGSIRFLRSDIDPTVLQALASPAGGEQVTLPQQ
jgi:prepilin-type processing-associated H-X9-DG protein